ncbi:MAG: DUF1156 domain-containing protein [Longimicrobiales bacterium]
MVKTRKKLIEVALPLDAINKAAAYEKMPGIGPHPRGLHLWWARRPLAAARAVIFAQMVHDPSDCLEEFPTDEAQEAERERLFELIEELVLWENTTNEAVFDRARAEIRRSWERICADNANHPRAHELFDATRPPPFHDPFAGGGALPLEAQRLGLESHASDLNPVAVLINKAMIEIPPRFSGAAAVNPQDRNDRSLIGREWKGAQGLAEDVRYYGHVMREEAQKRIGELYPKVRVTAAMARERPDLKRYAGKELTVIAWIWARTVASPNPAFADVEVPLASSWMLSTKKGKEAYVEPVVEGRSYRFTVRRKRPDDLEAARGGTKLGRGANFRCLVSNTPIPAEHVYSEARAGRMGARLMAVVAEGNRERVYLPPTVEMEEIAHSAQPEWKPDMNMPDNPRWFSPPLYGLTTYGDLFTPRQLTALATLSTLVVAMRNRIRADAVAAGMEEDGDGVEAGGSDAEAYAEAVSLYLAFAVSRVADFGNSLCGWNPSNQKVMHLFGKQSLPMVWDFSEANPLEDVVGGFRPAVDFIADCLLTLPQTGVGAAFQQDAMTGSASAGKVVSTDPPYYDNIGYADLSDFFYIWLRRTCRDVFPSVFGTLAVPKAEELIATPYRHDSKDEAERFFLDGMTSAMSRLSGEAHPAFPVTIYYAFKQSETSAGGGTASTGWETFLDAVIRAGFSISGTWPLRSEQEYRMVGMGTNALASSIVLVCLPREPRAPETTPREIVNRLNAEQQTALRHLQHGNIAPVDLAQASIGPGMGVYTSYSRVLEASGQPVSVREALALINETLDEVLAEQEGDFDADTRWAVAWFEQHGFDVGDYGAAETLSKAKNTSVGGMVEAGVIVSRAGKVRLLRPDELPAGWDPMTDPRLTAWEVVHHLIRVLEKDGEASAGSLVARLGGMAEVARELAYRLYTVCERNKRAQEALSYNALVQSWPEIVRLAQTPAGQSEGPAQLELA